MAAARALDCLVGRPVPHGNLEQARLPGPLGGLGLRGVEATADAHYVARVRGTAARVMAITGTGTFVDEQPCRQEAHLRDRYWVRIDVGGTADFEAAQLKEVTDGPWGK